jgi:hypothetical protein
MDSTLETPTSYDEFGLSNLLGKLGSTQDLSYQVLGLTNLLDRLKEAEKKINAFNIDDLLEDKSIGDNKIKRGFDDLEALSYLYLDRDTLTLHLGVETAGYRLALSAGSSTPRIFINENGNVGLNVQDPLYKLHMLGAPYFTNQVVAGLLGENPFTIVTGGPNTKGLVVKGTQYSGTYTSRWVAVGTRSGLGDTIAYSDDGIAWTAVTGLTIFSNNGNDVCWGGDKFVAVGATAGTNTLAYSADGISWTGLGSTIFSTSGNCVAWNGAIFLAGGSGTNTYAYSSNGIDWTVVPYSADNPFESGMSNVIWDGTKFIASGSSAALGTFIAYSSDHIHWTISISGTSSINSICTNGSIYLAAGSSQNVSDRTYYSVDGMVWSVVPIIHTINTYHIVWNGSFFLASGDDADTSKVLQISTDGITWASFPSSTYVNPSEYARATAWDGTKFVTGGSDSLVGYSATGVGWNRSAIPTMSSISALCSQRAPQLFPAMPGVYQTPTDQVANLAEWQNYLGEALAYVDAAGHGFFTLAAGATDSVVIESSGVLQKRTIDSRVWSATTLHNLNILEKTSNYTLTSSDDLVYANSASNFTLTLPDATGSGKVYYIKNVNTATITVDGDGSDTIDGETTQTVYENECLVVVDYVANKWMIV